MRYYAGHRIFCEHSTIDGLPTDILKTRIKFPWFTFFEKKSGNVIKLKKSPGFPIIYKKSGTFCRYFIGNIFQLFNPKGAIVREIIRGRTISELENIRASLERYTFLTGSPSRPTRTSPYLLTSAVP
jgi:hypothetical protein